MKPLSHLLLESASRALSLQDPETGAMPAGDNGPWSDTETPVRNTAHWLVTFSYAHQETGEERFENAAHQAIKYLQSNAVRPHNATFHCRDSDTKDSCNGLIGQAWVIEALCCAASVFDESELVLLADDVFTMHPFVDTLDCWRTVEINGEPSALDFTLNHQLWFAAAGGLLTKFDSCSQSVSKEVKQFLDELPTLMSAYNNGLIHHLLKPGYRPLKQGALLLENARALRVPKPILSIRNPSIPAEMQRKAVGYHSFNLYAFALLYEAFPDHSFWDSSIFTNALEYAFSDKFARDLEGNPYGYPYNCSGIEMAFVGEQFGLDDNVIDDWLNKQLSDHYNQEVQMMNLNTDDPETLAARLYEATRLNTANRCVRSV